MSDFFRDAYADFTLLTDGKEAFPAILSAIGQARHSLLINMFIWRDDAIGNQMAQAVLDAADRGVAVTVSVDRYGVVLEKCEESKRSFFHKTQRFSEWIKILILKLLYPMKGTPRRSRDTESELYRKILSHPNITLDTDRFKADHSKYYVVDNEILFVGGINIEDKENGSDMQGRAYQDYMVKITGKAHVQTFFDKLERGVDTSREYTFGINRKKAPRLFEMEGRYLDQIERAKEELWITMAYFSPLPAFVDAIVRAYRRGVKVTVMIPAHANFQDASNKKTVKRLMRLTNNGIVLLCSPKMVHTKLIMTDGEISLGSTNVTKKAFAQLDELNLILPRRDDAFCKSLLDSMEDNARLSATVTDYRSIHYNRFLAFLEGFLV